MIQKLKQIKIKAKMVLQHTNHPETKIYMDEIIDLTNIALIEIDDIEDQLIAIKAKIKF